MMHFFFEFRNNVWMFFLVLITCFAISCGMRFWQFEKWKQNESAYFVDEKPMMTTLDAPHWLRIAREYNEGKSSKGALKGALKDYPSGNKNFRSIAIPKEYDDAILFPTKKVSLETRYRDIPLLSFLIAQIAPYFKNNYFLTGTLLIPIFASLFILPLGFYFFRVGLPISGLLGGLIGTFSGGYYMRSSIGRIDTDMLNLFFPVLVGMMILLASQAKKERNVLLFSLGTGGSLFLFGWWYSKPGFTMIYFLFLIFCLTISKIQIRTILLSGFLFVLFVQPANFISATDSIERFFTAYFDVTENSNSVIIEEKNIPATFPNVFKTISEVEHLPMSDVLRRILSNTLLGWIGFLAFFGLAIFRWRVLLPLMPLLALGLLSFQSSNRFIMYLAPFIGIGLGWLIHLVVEGTFLFSKKIISQKKTEEKLEKSDSKARRQKIDTNKKFSVLDYLVNLTTKGANFNKSSQNLTEKTKFIDQEINWWNWLRQLVLYLGMGFFFLTISSQTAISYVPGPSIHPKVYATFLEVKKRVPEGAALMTWWDYGYAITDATGMATFHDGGGISKTPKTYFIARGLISSDPEELYDITQFLATEGIPGIVENNISPEALMLAVRNPVKKPWDPIYLFFTADMTGKYGAISQLGSWDIVNGGSKPRGYRILNCYKITNLEIECRGAKIDLNVGKINKQVDLKRLIFIRNGEVIREKEFGRAQGYTIQLILAGNRIVEVQFIDEQVFQSNYNQMFLLGKYSKELFEESYNAFPFSRLFRIKY